MIYDFKKKIEKKKSGIIDRAIINGQYMTMRRWDDAWMEDRKDCGDIQPFMSGREMGNRKEVSPARDWRNAYQIRAMIKKQD